MPSAPQNNPRISIEARRRKKMIYLGIGIFVLFTVALLQTSFNLTFLRPDTFGQTLTFAAFSALIFVGLIALTFVWLRILIKLYMERQTGLLGSKFRTKLVLGALLLSLGPVIMLFLFSYVLMNRSIDKWFSRPLEEVREHTAEVTQLLNSYAGQNALSEAQSIAGTPEAQKAYQTGKFSLLIGELRAHETTLQQGFVVALLDGQPEASFRLPDVWTVVSRQIPKIPEGEYRAFSWAGLDYVAARARAGERGSILVAMPLPAKYSAILNDLETSQHKYAALRSERRLVRRTYMQLLLLLTLLVLFGSTWFALFLAKLVTRPVLALAQGTKEISDGRLDYRVEVAAGDELADLVNSFNKMAAELEGSRRQIEASRKDLAGAYVTLEARGQHMETILESIPTAVLSLDANATVTHVNDALIRLFRPQGVERAGRMENLPLADFFTDDFTQELRLLLRRADRMGSTSAQMEVTAGDGERVLAITVASMNPRRSVPTSRRLGYVVVFEDLSELLQAQKQAAWREVARRIAHEIKNPLTPIALSAERIRRHISRGIPDESSWAILVSCADTIAGSVETVRRLVDEFSTLARFPAPQLRPSDLNAMVTDALKQFEGRLDGINVSSCLAQELPAVMADPEAIKRVISNLVDNSAEAMSSSVVRDLVITTALLGGKDAVELAVSDTGHGVTPELKEKLFMPYFSTKQRGTGLGLAIVARIIEDHHGTIRVEENSPVGARFVIELPVAAEAEGSATQTDASVAGGSVA